MKGQSGLYPVFMSLAQNSINLNWKVANKRGAGGCEHPPMVWCSSLRIGSVYTFTGVMLAVSS